MVSPRGADIENDQRDAQVLGQEGKPVAGIHEETRTQHQQAVRFFQLSKAQVLGSRGNVVAEEDNIRFHDAVAAGGTRGRDEMTHLIVSQLNIAIRRRFQFG